MDKRHIVILTRTVIFNETNELLVQHGLNSETDFYRLPGGHVKFREKLEDCVLREIREETGMDVARAPESHNAQESYTLSI